MAAVSTADRIGSFLGVLVSGAVPVVTWQGFGFEAGVIVGLSLLVMHASHRSSRLQRRADS